MNLIFYLSENAISLLRFVTISLILFLLLVTGLAQEVFYYAANGRPVDSEEGAVLIKQVREKSGELYVIRESHRSGKSWTRGVKQKVRIRDQGSMLILLHHPDKLLPKRIYREIEETAPGTFLFSDGTLNQVVRKGTSSRKLPLHLEGKVTEYHPNGEVKSISTYRDNQLVTNENWLPDGSRYIDSIFYSADIEPEYLMGPEFFNNYLLQRIAGSKIDLSQIEDEVVIGWVIMETGHLTGVIALEGKIRKFNQFLVDLITELPGEWEPARLNGAPVRYFMSIPLNFENRSTNFQEVELSSGMMHYSKY